AILCLFLGAKINSTLKILHNWNIPYVVTGGLIVACVVWALYLFTGLHIRFDLAARDILLLYFFTGIGLNINFSMIAKGSWRLPLLLALTAILMALQNLVAAVGV